MDNLPLTPEIPPVSADSSPTFQFQHRHIHRGGELKSELWAWGGL